MTEEGRDVCSNIHCFNQVVYADKLLSRVQLFAIPHSAAYHGISQARVLEWVAVSCSRGSSRTRYRAYVYCLVGRFFFFFNHLATWEAQL